MPSHEPPFKLDPHVAIRDPSSLPVLMVRAMHSVVRHDGGGNPSVEGFIKAFNIAAWTLTTAGRVASNSKKPTPSKKKAATRRRPVLRKKLAFKQRAGKKTTPKKTQRRINWRNEGSEARLIKGTLDTTALGAKLEQQAKQKSDTDAMQKDVERWAATIYRKNPSRYDKSWWTVNSG